MCTANFGNKYGLKYVERMVNFTNNYYGGKDLDAQNVVFVHGSNDPWSTMGRTTDLNTNSPAIVIPGNLKFLLILAFIT